MKLLRLLLPVLILTLFSCGLKNTGVEDILKGNHELRRFKVVTEEGYRTSGSFFLLSGSTSGGTYKDTKVSFSFQLPDSTYAMAEIDFGDIRVKIDESIERPYVSFKWAGERNADDMEYVMKHYVNYMIVYCKEEDFPYEVNITDL